MFLIYARYVIPASLFIPLIAAFIRYRFLSKPLKIILAYLVFSGLINGLNIIIAAHHIRTTSIAQIYSLFEFAFISVFYSFIFKRSWQKWIILFVIIFSVLSVLNSIFIQPLSEINTYSRSLSAIIMIGYCIIYINRQSLNETETDWGENSYNWINAGNLLYYASGLFMFIFSNYLLKASLKINEIVWSAHDTVLIFQYILFAIGFSKNAKTDR